MRRPGYLDDWEGFGVHKHVEDMSSFVKSYLQKVKQFKTLPDHRENYPTSHCFFIHKSLTA